MSKELDALKRFNSDVVVYNEYLYQRNLIDDELYRKNLEIIDKDYDLLKQALKRNEPMTIIFTRITNDITGDFWDEPTCPKCKSLVIYGDKYCRECGQKLDWSDEK